MLVEVEFSTLDAANAFTPPAWFGADVTADCWAEAAGLFFQGAGVRPLP